MGVPIAASVCLHAAVLVFLATRVPPPILSAKPVAMTIEFHEPKKVEPAPVEEVKPQPVVETPKKKVVAKKMVTEKLPEPAVVPEEVPVVVEQPKQEVVVEDMPRVAPKLVPTITLSG